jgi:membrane protein DedA with SNARE-associated domain
MIEKSKKGDLLSKIISRFTAWSILGGIIVALIAIVITELTPEPYKIMVENIIIMTLSGIVLGGLIFLFVTIIYALEKKRRL